MSYWRHLAGRFHGQNTGPMWELPDGRQLRIDYRSTSILMELSERSGESLFQMAYYRRSDMKPTMCDVLWVRSDSERVFFESFRAYLREGIDLGHPPPVEPGISPFDYWRLAWDPDWSTSVTWEWTSEELMAHLAQEE